MVLDFGPIGAEAPPDGPVNKLKVVSSDLTLADLARRGGKTFNRIQEMKPKGHSHPTFRAGRGGEVIHRLPCELSAGLACSP